MKQDLSHTEIEILFKEFLLNKALVDKDLAYCLLQSSVEPIIRFKFGAWLNEYFSGSPRLTLNLMEAKRLDLTVGIDDQVYFIEFGHLLNILKHKSDLNKSKVAWDSIKMSDKVEKIKSKINKIDSSFIENKKMNYLTCSLFSEFKLEEKENIYQVKTDTSPLSAGALFKYGNIFKVANYYKEYHLHLNNQEESEYLFGYSEAIIIPEKLSLHYKFKAFEL